MEAASRVIARRPAQPKSKVVRILDDAGESLLDLVDNLLDRGVMVNGELIIGVAEVDLVYLRLSVLLCAADRIMPTVTGPKLKKRRR